MIDKIDVSDIEDYCKEKYQDAESVIHRWGHVSRVARGARWLIKVRNGSKKDQKLAYLAGLLHDIVRPVTEERCHAELSAEKAAKILERFDLDEEDISKVCRAIKDHRRPVERWVSELHRSIYLSDKVFEHMGAYLDFRACVWSGELSNTDYKDMEAVEAVLTYYDEASDKFLNREFPEFIEPIVAYQRQWNRRFKDELKKGKTWAEDMAVRLYKKGKEKADFEETLRDFESAEDEQRRWKKEMISYLDSDLDTSIFNVFINKSKSGTEF